MGRPLTEFIFAQNLPWAVGLPGGARSDVEAKVLSQDDDTGAITAIIRYPAGWSRTTPEALAAEEELYVLDGAMTISGHSYARDSYGCLPPHYARTTAVSDQGCVTLSFFNSLPELSGKIGAVADDAVCVEGLNTLEMPWDASVPDPSLEWMGNRRKVLKWDPVHKNQKATFLLASPPHIYPVDWKCPTLTHPCAEELFMLSGDTVGPHGAMTTGAYFWRPAGVAHGPFGIRTGQFSLIRFVDGLFVNEWGDEDVRFTYDSPYRPVVPDHLAAYAKAPYEGGARY